MNSEKTEFINELLMDMSGKLTEQQMDELFNSLNVCLKDFSIAREEFLPSTELDDNEKYMKLFRAAKRLEGMSPKTIEQYLFQSKLMLNTLGMNFRDVTAIHIQFYLSDYERTHDISKRSLDNMKKAINGWYIWLEANDYIVKNPFRSIGRIYYENKPIEILSDDEIVAMRDMCATYKGMYGLRLRAIIDFLLATGVRVSEIMAVDIPDVDFRKNEVLIHSAKKRSAEDRRIFLTAEANKHLRDYLEKRYEKGWMATNALFAANKKTSRRLTERDFNMQIQELAKKCGITKHCTVHIFRKTMASILFRRGMSPSKIAKILGHCDSRTSETYYIEIDNEDVKRDYLKYR